MELPPSSSAKLKKKKSLPDVTSMNSGQLSCQQSALFSQIIKKEPRDYDNIIEKTEAYLTILKKHLRQDSRRLDKHSNKKIPPGANITPTGPSLEKTKIYALERHAQPKPKSISSMRKFIPGKENQPQQLAKTVVSSTQKVNSLCFVKTHKF